MNMLLIKKQQFVSASYIRTNKGTQFQTDQAYNQTNKIWESGKKFKQLL